MWYEVFFFKKPKHCNFYSTKRELILVWRKRIKRELILETREEMFHYEKMLLRPRFKNAAIGPKNVA